MEKPQSERGAADCPSGNRFPAAANGPRAPVGGRGSQRRHAADHAARGLVAGREGPGPEPAALPRCRSFTGSCSPTPPTSCGRRSSGSPGSRCEKRPRKSKRRRAPWCRSSRPAPWCRCSCSPRAYLRTVGAGTDRVFGHKKRTFCHVSFVEEKPGSRWSLAGRMVFIACSKSRCWRFAART